MSPRHNSPERGLFVSYDGLLEPLGQSQVLPYVISLADSGVGMHVISFEKKTDLADVVSRKRLDKQLQSHGVTWTRLTYHPRPRLVSTLFDLVLGTWVCVREARQRRARIVHARSYVPALMALTVKWLSGARFLFDMRGFWPEERVELGIFPPKGVLFRLSKWMESLFFRHADHLVVLSQRAKEVLEASPHWQEHPREIAVIPCCVDQNRFSANEPNVELAERHGLIDKFVVGNIGAINRRYLLPEMFRFAARLKEHLPQLRFVYLTRQDPTPLFRVAQQEGLAPSDLVAVGATPDEVPDWLSLFKLGIFFLQPSYAAQASCFTKLGEFLAAGVPVVTNSGVGDVEQILVREHAGVVVSDFSATGMTSAAARAFDFVSKQVAQDEACRRAADLHFSLDKGCASYLDVYQSLLTERGRPEGDVLRFLSKKNDVWFPKLKPVPVMGTEKENHTSWERYYRVSDCSSSSRNNWYLGR